MYNRPEMKSYQCLFPAIVLWWHVYLCTKHPGKEHTVKALQAQQAGNLKANIKKSMWDFVPNSIMISVNVEGSHVSKEVRTGFLPCEQHSGKSVLKLVCDFQQPMHMLRQFFLPSTENKIKATSRPPGNECRNVTSLTDLQQQKSHQHTNGFNSKSCRWTQYLSM